MVKEKEEISSFIFNLDWFINIFYYSFGFYYFPSPSHSEKLLLKPLFSFFLQFFSR